MVTSLELPVICPVEGLLGAVSGLLARPGYYWPALHPLLAWVPVKGWAL